MDGGVVMEGARICIPNSRPSAEHDEAWKRVSKDLSWMHSCNYMWDLISTKLTELKETRDQAARIAARGAAAPAERGAVLDGYFPAPAVGLEVGAVVRGMHFEAAPVAARLALPAPPQVPKNLRLYGRLEDWGLDESRRTGWDQFKIPSQPTRPEELTDGLKAKDVYVVGACPVAPHLAPPVPPQVPPPVPKNLQPLRRMDNRGSNEFRGTGRDQFETPLQTRKPEELTDVAGARIPKAKEAPPVPPLLAPPVPPQAPPPVSKNLQPLRIIEDGGPDESRRTGRDQLEIPLQRRKQEELTDVARGLKVKEAYMIRPPAPPQAKDSVPEPRTNAVGEDSPRDNSKKGREVEVRRGSAAGGTWKGAEEQKGLAGGRREERRRLGEDRREESKGTVTIKGEARRGVVEGTPKGRQGVERAEKTEQSIAQAAVEVGEKRKRVGDTERKQGPEKRSRDSSTGGQAAVKVGEKRKRVGDTERKQGPEKRSRGSSTGGQVPTARKDTRKNENLQVVRFRTEGGRAVHLAEKVEQKSCHPRVATTDPGSAEETSQEASNSKSSTNEGAGTVCRMRKKPGTVDEASSEPRKVMSNGKDMPTRSAGNSLPIKRKRMMDDVTEDEQPAKRPVTAQTFRAFKVKSTSAENANVSNAKAATAPVVTRQALKANAAPAPSVTHQALKAKATGIPVKTKPHVIQITSIDIKTKKKKPDPEEPELEFKCGCTSKELGETVGHMKVYKSGELVIFCECKPGCPEAGKPLSPPLFERHAGRGAAKKWKNTIWLVVGDEKVLLYKVPDMQPYIEKNKRKNLIKT